MCLHMHLEIISGDSSVGAPFTAQVREVAAPWQFSPSAGRPHDDLHVKINSELSHKNKTPSFFALCLSKLIVFFTDSLLDSTIGCCCCRNVDVEMGSSSAAKGSSFSESSSSSFSSSSFLRHHSSFLFLLSLNLTTFLECKDGKIFSDFDHDVRKCDGQMHFHGVFGG